MKKRIIGRGISEGLKILYEDGLYGFCDENGKTVIKAAFEAVRPFCGEFAAAKLHGKWGFINKKGKTVIEFQYEDVYSDTFEGTCIVQKGEETLEIDLSGMPIGDIITDPSGSMAP